MLGNTSNGLIEKFAILAAICLFSICDTSSFSREKRNGKILVTTIEETPFTMRKDGNFIGYIPDLMKKLEEHTGQEYELHIVKDGYYGAKNDLGIWNGMVEELLKETAKIAAAPFTINEQRKEVLNFSDPFLTFNLAFLTMKSAESNKIKSFADLAKSQYKYGVVKDGATHAFLKNSKDINIENLELFNSYAEGIKKVRDSNGSFGMIIESLKADYEIGRAPCNLTSTMLEGAKSNSYALAFKKGENKELMDKINKGLAALSKTSDMEHLKHKWWNEGRVCSRMNSFTFIDKWEVTMRVALALLGGAVVAFL